jgi:hypothetical protein
MTNDEIRISDFLLVFGISICWQIGFGDARFRHVGVTSSPELDVEQADPAPRREGLRSFGKVPD